MDYNPSIPSFTSADRAIAVTAIAAREFNDEMSIILNAVTVELEYADEWAQPNLLEIQGAVKRCMIRSGKILEYCARKGYRPTNAGIDRLMAG